MPAQDPYVRGVLRKEGERNLAYDAPQPRRLEMLSSKASSTFWRHLPPTSRWLIDSLMQTRHRSTFFKGQSHFTGPRAILATVVARKLQAMSDQKHMTRLECTQ